MAQKEYLKIQNKKSQKGEILQYKNRLTDEKKKTDWLSPITRDVHFYLLVFSPFLFSFLSPNPQPLCFDSTLYLYFKWLNYIGSCGENYGCFPLFLSLLWDSMTLPCHQSTPPLPSTNLFCPPAPPVLLSSSFPSSFLWKCSLYCVSICDWEEIIAKWACVWALFAVNWQRECLAAVFPAAKASPVITA